MSDDNQAETTDHRSPEVLAKLEWDRTPFWDEYWHEGSNSYNHPESVGVLPIQKFEGSPEEGRWIWHLWHRGIVDPRNEVARRIRKRQERNQAMTTDAGEHD